MKKQSLVLVAALALMTSACATLCEEDDMCTANKEVVFTTSPAMFAFDSATLTAADKAGLDKVAERLKANPDEKVQVNGYTDITGPASYNVDLSKRRANAVRDYLVEQGVCAKRITTKGYGATNFVNDTNATKADRARNRRAEVVID